MASLLEIGGLTLERVIIHAIEDNTFRAVLKLSGAGGGSELDARPSDAIALALRTGSGIWMLEEVVADASIPVDAEADAEDAADFRRFLDAVSPAELVRQISKAHPEAPAEGGEAEGEADGEPDAAPDAGPDAEPDADSEADPGSPGGTIPG
jgi:hypothetical protein